MYINYIKIKNFRILENVTIDFQIPDTESNVINVIAGVNGSGKTSLLELIKETLLTSYSKVLGDFFIQLNDQYKVNYKKSITPPMQVGNKRCFDVVRYTQLLNTENKFKNGTHSSPRLIYSPAKLAFQYTQVASLNTTYKFQNIINTQTLLGEAEYYIREYIIAKERQNHNSDPEVRTREAIEAFNQHFSSVQMTTKLYNLDIHQLNKPVFKNAKGDLVNIEQLSDGEKQLYGRVVALMILNPTNSIILIDEPEISLHPSWQFAIMQIYAQIGEGNQFIIATHSPHIIANTPYQNLILLNRNVKTGKIETVKPSSPASGTDVNSILNEIIGADFMPQDQQQ
ncbi:MAG: AAA family ATPase, partial [Methylococcales bacterium]|nr:AAA family ATPase [Methylococcales bacterium]